MNRTRNQPQKEHNYPNQRILVTGAAGFFGRNLVPSLVSAGYEVLAIDRLPNPNLPVAEYLIGDIARNDILKYVKDPIHQIVHLAANVYMCNSYDCVIDNMCSTITLANWADNMRVNRLIFPSTASIYQIPDGNERVEENHPIRATDLYSLSKFLGEIVFKQCLTPALILRYTYLYGQGHQNGAIARIIQDARSGIAPKIRSEGRDYLSVQEAVSAVLLALQYEGPHALFHFGTGKLVPMVEIARRILEHVHGDTQIQIAGSRTNVALNTGLASKELRWQSSSNILDDIGTLI